MEVLFINNLKVFKNQEFGEVRTVTINDVPYFVGKDVAEILGYVNTKDALASHVEDYNSKVGKRYLRHSKQGTHCYQREWSL